jgi:cytochrome c oxidase cbb3-type subunit 4
MQTITIYLNALTTLFGLLIFLGIVRWAWSKERQSANQASAQIPFDLPDEYKKDPS